MTTLFGEDVCYQKDNQLCGHCWACAMRRGLEDRFAHEDQCLSPTLVDQLLDFIHALREIDKSAERHCHEEQAVSEAAKMLMSIFAALCVASD
jgi:hypothetical protein